jgi:hypothetical protein
MAEDHEAVQFDVSGVFYCLKEGVNAVCVDT